MLADGRLPNAFRQGLRFAEPDVDVDIARVVRAPRETHLGRGLTYSFGQFFVIPVKEAKKKFCSSIFDSYQ